MATKIKVIDPTEIKHDSLDNLNLEDVPGLGPKSATMLKDGGITSVSELMNSTLQELEILGLTRPISKKLRQAVKDLFPKLYQDFIEDQSLEDIEGIGPTTAKSLREKGMNIHLLLTSCAPVNS